MARHAFPQGRRSEGGPAGQRSSQWSEDGGSRGGADPRREAPPRRSLGEGPPPPADLGYYSHRLFAKIGENGGLFVAAGRRARTRSSSARSRFIGATRIDLEGKRLGEVLPRLQRQTLDAEVELAFRRRTYNGQRSGDTLRCRLVAVWDKAEETTTST